MSVNEIMKKYDCSCEIAQALHNLQDVYGNLEDERGCNKSVGWFSLSNVVLAILGKEIDNY